MVANMKKYSVFGLTVESQILLPELPPGKNDADVTVLLGEVPFNEDSIGVTYRISRTEFTFKIDSLAKFLVKDSNLIVIDPCDQADPQTLRVYLLGTGFGVMLIQKEIVPIHGSSIVIDGKALILTGNCGAGKSTLSSWFQKSGYGFLSDDISAIRLDTNGSPFVYPSFSQQRVNKDTALRLNLDIGSLSPACLHDDKYILDQLDSFISYPVPLHSIIILAEDEVDRVRIEQIKGTDKIHYFIDNVYCSVLYKEIAFSKSFFSHCLRIAQQIPMYRLRRPRGIHTADEQKNLILNALF